MTDNVVTFTRPTTTMPPRWRKHVDALAQVCAEIDALRKRLKQEGRDFLDVMKDDMNHMNNPSITPSEHQAIGTASWHLDKNVRDALTLLECASERVSYAAPHDYEFQGPAA